MTEASSIGERVRLIRESRQISQAELARRAGLSKSNVNNIEGSGSQNPSLGTLGAIADALQVHIGTILGIVADQTPALSEVSAEQAAALAGRLGFIGPAAAEGRRFFLAETSFALHAKRFHPGDLLLVDPMEQGKPAAVVTELQFPTPAFQARLFLDPYLIGTDAGGSLTHDIAQNPAIAIVGEIKSRLGRAI